MTEKTEHSIRTLLTVGLAASLSLSLCACGLQKSGDQIPIKDDSGEISIVGVADPAVTPEQPQPLDLPPAPTPTPEPTMPPLPDIDINSFEFRLANSYNSVGMEYVPQYSGFEGQGIDGRIFDAADAFLKAAREAGFEAWYSTAYRNPDYLNSRYFSYLHNHVNNDPVAAAEGVLAPGLEEHQLGLAVDFTDQLYRSALYDEFEDDYMLDTDLYRWAVEHCTEYGFILRYPEGKEAYYGTACRHPAHFRYVGREAAQYITENNLCLEEFLLMYEGNSVYLPLSDEEMEAFVMQHRPDTATGAAAGAQAAQDSGQTALPEQREQTTEAFQPAEILVGAD